MKDCLIDGSLSSSAEPHISILDSSYHRGYGIFEYFHVYKGKPFMLSEHIDRLFLNLKKINLSPFFSKQEVIEQCLSLIEQFTDNEGGIRIIVSHGESDFEDMLLDTKPKWVIQYIPFIRKSKTLSLLTTPMKRTLPDIKSTCYIAGVVAFKQAKTQGFDDILFTDDNGGILELSRANIFFISEDNTLITDDSTDILKGLTRAKTLEIARELSIPILFKRVELKEISSYPSCFATSSTKELMAIHQINTTDFDVTHSHIKNIHNRFIQLRNS